MKDINTIRDDIVQTMVPQISSAGWRWDIAAESAMSAGYEKMTASAVFPDGINDVVAHFSDMVDRRMVDMLKTLDTDSLRVRDRIKEATLARLEVLESLGGREAAKAAIAFWALPMRILQGQRVLWRTSDRIWIWAGDQAQDYNRYTKRGLLSSLLVATTLVWCDDRSPENEVTKGFLDRRIENIMEIGRAFGTIGNKIPDITKPSRTARA